MARLIIFVMVVAVMASTIWQSFGKEPSGKAWAAEIHYSKHEVLKGVARAKDGDSLVLMGKEIRLHGIDAVEFQQHCFYGLIASDQENTLKESWPCGKRAHQLLQQLADQGEMTCYVQAIDKYRRLVSVCFVGSLDIASLIVEQGYAIAIEWFSDYYVPIAQKAKQQKRGIWQGFFDKPSSWRKKHYRKKTQKTKN